MFGSARTAAQPRTIPATIMFARGKAPGVPYTEYLFGGDHSLIWWNPDATTTSTQLLNQKPGAPMYLEGGQRYLQGKLPKGEPAFFDSKTSVAELPTDPVPIPDYPCDDCPSTGNGQTPSASS